MYYYSQATSATEAQKEAKWVVNALEGYDIDLPVEWIMSFTQVVV